MENAIFANLNLTLLLHATCVQTQFLTSSHAHSSHGIMLSRKKKKGWKFYSQISILVSERQSTSITKTYQGISRNQIKMQQIKFFYTLYKKNYNLSRFFWRSFQIMKVCRSLSIHIKMWHRYGCVNISMHMKMINLALSHIS